MDPPMMCTKVSPFSTN